MAFDVLDVVPHLFWGQLDFYARLLAVFIIMNSVSDGLLLPQPEFGRPGNRPGQLIRINSGTKCDCPRAIRTCSRTALKTVTATATQSNAKPINRLFSIQRVQPEDP